MNDLKKAIKVNLLKIDLGVFDNGEFNPSACSTGCEVRCEVRCACGCGVENSPGNCTC
jgi:hypothetical protein